MEERPFLRPGGLRKRSVGVDASQTPLNLQVGFTVEDGGVIQATPSPSTIKTFTDDGDSQRSSLTEFRKKQQSFEIHIEDCDEEELSVGSDDDGDEAMPDRPVTPAQIFQYPDYSGNISHKEQPAKEKLLTVEQKEADCLTDVSEGESDNEEDTEDDPNMPQTVIKRVPA